MKKANYGIMCDKPFVHFLTTVSNYSHLKSTRRIAGISKVVRPGSRRGLHICVGVSRKKGCVPEVGVVDDDFPFSFTAPVHPCNHAHVLYIPTPFILKTMEICVVWNMATACNTCKVKRSRARHKSPAHLYMYVLVFWSPWTTHIQCVDQNQTWVLSDQNGYHFVLLFSF